MASAHTAHEADYNGSAQRYSRALLLLAIAGLLNSCGGGGGEQAPAPGGGGGAIVCITGPGPTAIVTWDAVNATGYRIYSRTASGNFTLLQDAGTSTTLTVSGLISGTTYYFVATAYDSLTPPNESIFSNEVCKTIS